MECPFRFPGDPGGNNPHFKMRIIICILARPSTGIRRCCPQIPSAEDQTHGKLRLPPLELSMTPVPSEPVHLIEDAETGDRILIYGTEKGVTLELRYEGETLWMTQPQIAELF